MKLQLPTVTLFCADCVNVPRAVRAIECSKALCDFGDVKFFTSLETDYPHIKCRHLGSLNDYSAFLLKEVYKHIHTSHILIVQHDGWVINTAKWNPDWLKLDYIGPLFMQETHVDANSVGVGGFCLRSKRLMEAVNAMLPAWDGKNSYSNPGDGRNDWGHEDGVISKHLRQRLLAHGFKFGSPAEAGKFSIGGNPHPTYYCNDSFGFHRLFPDAVTRLKAAGIDIIKL